VVLLVLVLGSLALPFFRGRAQRAPAGREGGSV
jgi:hypothetical protein